jgi:hypothetical protein
MMDGRLSTEEHLDQICLGRHYEIVGDSAPFSRYFMLRPQISLKPRNLAQHHLSRRINQEILVRASPRALIFDVS